MLLVPPQIKLALAAAALAGAAWGAWQYQANRYGAQIARIHEAHAVELSKAYLAANKQATTLAELEAKHLARLRGLQNENVTLAADLAANRKWLRIKATCVPDTSGSTGTLPDGDAAAARLDPSAERAYTNLRVGAEQALTQILILQDYADTVSNTPKPTH